jgi:hypothetical protein
VKIQKMLPVFLFISCALGLEVKPDSSSFTVQLMQKYSKVLDTITLYNGTEGPIQIDTMSIAFLNGDSAECKFGNMCDSANWSCYNYSGWLYGMTDTSLRYSKDSLFILQDQNGKLLRYMLQPKDSLKFCLRIITNCPVCGRLPSFPATTKFRYSFITTNGEKASFLLTLNRATAVSGVRIPCRYQSAERSKPCYTLRGQKTDIRSPVGILVRNRETIVGLNRDTKEILHNK